MELNELMQRLRAVSGEYRRRYGHLGRKPCRYRWLGCLVILPIPKPLRCRLPQFLKKHPTWRHEVSPSSAIEKANQLALAHGRHRLHQKATDYRGMEATMRQIVSLLDEMCALVEEKWDSYLGSHIIFAVVDLFWPPRKSFLTRRSCVYEQLLKYMRVQFSLWTLAITEVDCDSKVFQYLKTQAVQLEMFPDYYYNNIAICLRTRDAEYADCWTNLKTPYAALLMGIPPIVGLYIGSKLLHEATAQQTAEEQALESRIGFLHAIFMSNTTAFAGILKASGCLDQDMIVLYSIDVVDYTDELKSKIVTGVEALLQSQDGIRSLKQAATEISKLASIPRK